MQGGKKKLKPSEKKRPRRASKRKRGKGEPKNGKEVIGKARKSDAESPARYQKEREGEGRGGGRECQKQILFAVCRPDAKSPYKEGRISSGSGWRTRESRCRKNHSKGTENALRRPQKRKRCCTGEGDAVEKKPRETKVPPTNAGEKRLIAPSWKKKNQKAFKRLAPAVCRLIPIGEPGNVEKQTSMKSGGGRTEVRLHAIGHGKTEKEKKNNISSVLGGTPGRTAIWGTVHARGSERGD